jgi:hypothetical protein
LRYHVWTVPSINREDAMEFGWKRHRLDLDFNVVDLVQAESGDMWAVAQCQRRGETASAILRRRLAEWECVVALESSLNAISAHRDQSIVAVGESSVHIDGRGWVVRKLDLPCNLVWGAHASCVYALSGEMLFHFDGREWVPIDLAAKGIRGDWADGDCDSTGTSWIAGTWETHSCMARGRGTRWKPDGCGSWYLYNVCIDDGGVGFAVGGDGLWQRSGSRWAQVEAYGDDLGRLPIAVGTHAGGAVVVTLRIFEQPTVAEFEVFVGDVWRTVPLPIRPDRHAQARLVVEILEGRRILLGQGSEVWESDPLS